MTTPSQSPQSELLTDPIQNLLRVMLRVIEDPVITFLPNGPEDKEHDRVRPLDKRS